VFLTIQELKDLGLAEAKEAAKKLQVARLTENEKDIVKWKTYIERNMKWLTRLAEFED
jgi:hypothetical protein